MDEHARKITEELKLSVQELHEIIVRLKHPQSHSCCPRHYDGGHRHGPCGEAQLTSFVYTRIDELNKETSKREKLIHAEFESKWMQFVEEYTARQADFELRLKQVREEAEQDSRDKVNNLNLEVARLLDQVDVLTRERMQNELLLEQEQ